MEPPQGLGRPRGRRGPERAITLDGLAGAAVALADDEGYDAVTMRAVARRLGVGAPSLYRYVATREELIALMVDTVVAEINLPGAIPGSWLDGLVLLAERQLAVYRRHPWLVAAASLPLVMGPRTLDLFEWCLQTLAPVAAPTSRKMEALAMITGVVVIFTRPPRTTAVNPFSLLDPTRHPRLVATLTAPPGHVPDLPDLFRRTIRGVLSTVLDD